MYYHPSILPAFVRGGPTFDTCRVIGHLWLDGVEPRHGVQMDAWNDVCTARRDAARGPSDVQDACESSTRALQAEATDPFRLVAVASELCRIALDMHRSAIEVLGGDNARSAKPTVRARAEPAEPQRHDEPSANRRRRQMMA